MRYFPTADQSRRKMQELLKERLDQEAAKIKESIEAAVSNNKNTITALNLSEETKNFLRSHGYSVQNDGVRDSVTISW